MTDMAIQRPERESGLHVAMRAEAQISAHELVCAERWLMVRRDVSDLKEQNKQQSRLLLGILVSVLGFLAAQVYGYATKPATPAPAPTPPAAVQRLH